ncbi:MAG: hypothetical protein HRU38_23965 [Saccharospirillaceae bacterium]|nr:hypothetical protein [Pseudomonadales bacterium]NRB81679.1 hypothetical protein [Saccharospirillaceae bacterium]
MKYNKVIKQLNKNYVSSIKRIKVRLEIDNDRFLNNYHDKCELSDVPRPFLPESKYLDFLLHYISIDIDVNQFSEAASLGVRFSELTNHYVKSRGFTRKDESQMLGLNASWKWIIIGLLIEEESDWKIQRFICFFEKDYEIEHKFDVEFLNFIYVLFKKYRGEKVRKEYVEKVGRFLELLPLLEDYTNISNVLDDYLMQRIIKADEMMNTGKNDDYEFLTNAFNSIMPLEILLLIKVIEKTYDVKIDYDNDYLKKVFWEKVHFQPNLNNDIANKYEGLIRKCYLENGLNYDSFDND